MGHASAKEPLDTYSHLWPSDAERIRAAVEATLGPEPVIRAGPADNGADFPRTFGVALSAGPQVTAI